MSDCFYCGPNCEDTSIYVIGEGDDPDIVKVGYTKFPTKRLSSLRKKTGRDLHIIKILAARCEFKAMDIEGEAHKILAQYWSGRGEWFLCSPDIAFSAVKAAAKRLGIKGKRR